MIKLDTVFKSYHNSLLSNIALVSIELAREINSKAGSKTSVAIREAMKRHHHKWYKTSQYGIAIDPTKGAEYELGVMEKEKGNEVNPGSLLNFIGWFNMEKNTLKPTTVVAGAMPPNTPIRREDGVRKGYMEAQQGTGMATIALLTRIDQGIYTPDYEKYFGKNEVIVNPRAYNFIAEGRRNSLSAVNATIEQGWLNSVGVAFNNFNLKEKIVVWA